MKRTTILLLVTALAIIAGTITVLATPKYQEVAARPVPGALLVVETTPTPTPTPAPTASPTPSPTQAPSGTVTIPMPVKYQTHGLDCETAALQMGLAALGFNYTQDQLIAMQPKPDLRQPVMGTINGHKAVLQWGNPYKNFVGNIDGADLIPTGYGVYYPPIVGAAKTAGASGSYGGEHYSAADVYSALGAGHPVLVWVETGWGHPYVGHWTTFDEKIQIQYSLIEHVVTLSGVSATQVRVNDPWKSGSQYWFSKAAFEASWADFNNMAVILQ